MKEQDVRPLSHPATTLLRDQDQIIAVRSQPATSTQADPSRPGITRPE
jgi:hypothetical protein